MKLLLATNNQGKVQEYKELLAQSQSSSMRHKTRRIPFVLVTPAQIGVHLEVEENGATFEQNAVIKAKAFASASGLTTLADDSGLEVDALGGEPGVRSARYDGPTDLDRIHAILAKLKGTPLEKRSARFRCVVAIAIPDGRFWTSEGQVEGLISFAPRGRGGFGYDPIFYIPSLNRTMAQIPRSLKNTISHRARAVQGILPTIARLSAKMPDP